MCLCIITIWKLRIKHPFSWIYFLMKFYILIVDWRKFYTDKHLSLIGSSLINFELFFTLQNCYWNPEMCSLSTCNNIYCCANCVQECVSSAEDDDFPKLWYVMFSIPFETVRFCCYQCSTCAIQMKYLLIIRISTLLITESIVFHF